MTPDFCVDALTEAIARYGAPEIVNTDQGSQFTKIGGCSGSGHLAIAAPATSYAIKFSPPRKKTASDA
jgi:hypothetical protein